MKYDENVDVYFRLEKELKTARINRKKKLFSENSIHACIFFFQIINLFFKESVKSNYASLNYLYLFIFDCNSVC